VKERAVPKIIKTKADYAAALASIDRLIALDPEPGTPDADELEVLTVLVRDYEGKQFPVQLPDSVEALQFRMEQMGLSQRDLVPFIGSRARVSEILSRKRPLTLGMLKALHTGLGIPAAVLLRGEEQAALGNVEEELAQFPIKEMLRRQWLRVPKRASELEIVRALKSSLAPLTEAASPIQVLARKTQHERADRPNDRHALMAWTARVIEMARAMKPRGRYQPGCLTPEVLNGLVHLSALDDGPRKAQDYLSKYGITLVVVEHMPQTRLDGAVFFMAPDRPVVALTLRFDRVDNFWFTLLHEIGHLLRDFGEATVGFFDDLESTSTGEPREVAADAFARDTLIPPAEWERSPLRDAPNPGYVRDLAARLGIHTAIVAGRVRKEHSSYRILSNLVGHGDVRALFQDELSEASA
jgi:HTH-type transcriptional regulator/antitoxin HigA